MNRDDVPHGSYSTYVNHGCRCDACRQANTDYARHARQSRYTRRDNMTLPHGSLSTYMNWGCRCPECKAANAANGRRWRSR